MADVRRKLARDNSSRAAGRTAYALRKFSRADGEEQELLPGIPNHVSIGNIASKLDWDTCNVLQVVSRGWHQAIQNRHVYDAKVLSKSTEAFLVLLSHEKQGPVSNLVFTLCTCRENHFLRLPPIPPLNVYSMPPQHSRIDCICLEGRVYLWIQMMDTIWVQLYVLDLAGDRKWAERKPTRCPDARHGIGALGGNIYRFRGSHFCGVLQGEESYIAVGGQPLSIKEKVQRMPHTEIYDPLHDVWSLITPASPVSVDVCSVHSEHHSTSFSDWEEEKLAADPSKTFLTNGRRERFASESKQKQSREMAGQIYYSYLSGLRYEEVLFLGGNLVKYESLLGYAIGDKLDIQEYDAQTNMWEHWKSVSKNFQPLKEGCVLSIKTFVEFAVANNSFWAVVGGHSINHGLQLVKYFLVRSPKLVWNDNVQPVLWVDTGFRMGSSKHAARDNYLRPIYL